MLRAAMTSNEHAAERDEGRSARREADAMRLSAYNAKVQAIAGTITHAASAGKAEMHQQVASPRSRAERAVRCN